MTSGKRIRSALGRLVVLFLLGNVPFAFFHSDLGFYRGVFNIDYLAVPLLAAIGASPWVVAGSFAVVHLADVLRGFAPVFNFGLIDAIASLGNLFVDISLPLLGALLGGLIWVIAASRTASRLFANPFRRPSIAVIGAVGAVIGVLDVSMWPGGGLAARLTGAPWVNVAYSGVGAVASAAWWDIADGKLGQEQIQPPAVIGATASLLKQARDGDVLPAAIVLVLVESLGQPLDSIASSHLFAPFYSGEIKSRYRIRQGTVPFSGATTAAEMRELCGIRATHRAALRVDGGGCLPSILRARGYHTVGIHGNLGRVFGRNQWYPRVGFDEVRWNDAFVEEPCGTIVRGACDNNVAAAIVRDLSVSPHDRLFVYWLTLSTHWPFDREYASRAGPCPDWLGPGHNDATRCDLFGGLARTIGEIASLLEDGRAGHPLVVVVGDHRPPVLRTSLSLLFAHDVVPFFEFVPRRVDTTLAR